MPSNSSAAAAAVLGLLAYLTHDKPCLTTYKRVNRLEIGASIQDDPAATGPPRPVVILFFHPSRHTRSVPRQHAGQHDAQHPSTAQLAFNSRPAIRWVAAGLDFYRGRKADAATRCDECEKTLL